MKHEIWSFIEKENDKLHNTACKMAAEAKRTAGIFDAVPCGIMMGTPSPENFNQYGLEKIYACDCRQSIHSPEMVAGVIHDMAVKRKPQFILFAQTPLGSEVAGRLSASLKKGLIADCIDFEQVDNQPCAKKPVYEGKAHALVTWLTPPPYLSTIDPASLEDVKEKKIVKPEVICTKLNVKASGTRLLEKWTTDLSKLDLTEARVVIGIGKAVNAQIMEDINKLAVKINGVVGGTRIAVHSGLIPVEKQIGTTGKWLSSDIYLAIGISGAPQHVMGIKDVKTTIAINISRDVPIFKIAKLGVVGDLYHIVPVLMRLLENSEP